MIAPNDGGPVHPVQGFTADASGALTGQTVISTGASMRDFLAATAPSDSLSLPERASEAAEALGITREEYGKDSARHWYVLVARERYRYADAMLAARGAK